MIQPPGTPQPCRERSDAPMPSADEDRGAPRGAGDRAERLPPAPSRRMADQERDQRNRLDQDEQADALRDRDLLQVGAQALRRGDHEGERARQRGEQRVVARPAAARRAATSRSRRRRPTSDRPRMAKLAGQVCIWCSVSCETPPPAIDAEHEEDRRRQARGKRRVDAGERGERHGEQPARDPAGRHAGKRREQPAGGGDRQRDDRATRARTRRRDARSAGSRGRSASARRATLARRRVASRDLLGLAQEAEPHEAVAAPGRRRCPARARHWPRRPGGGRALACRPSPSTAKNR